MVLYKKKKKKIKKVNYCILCNNGVCACGGGAHCWGLRDGRDKPRSTIGAGVYYKAHQAAVRLESSCFIH